jgi:hypothetical protein
VVEKKWVFDPKPIMLATSSAFCRIFY